MDEIQDLEKRMIEVSTAYYEGRRIITDAEFNEMADRLKALSPNHPYLTTPGWGYAPKGGVPHKMQIKTAIIRCYDYGDFISRFDGSGRYVLMPKYDGITVSIYCSNYTLERILTRGNGIVGKSIAVDPAWDKQLKEICHLLDTYGGEGMINCTMSLPSEKEFGKARDAAAEALFSDGKYCAEMVFFPHAILTGEGQTKLIDSVSRTLTHLPSEDEIKEIYQGFQLQGYDCDGIVLRQGSNRYVYYCG